LVTGPQIRKGRVMQEKDYFDSGFEVHDAMRLVLLVAFADGTLDLEELHRAEEVFTQAGSEFFGLNDHDILVGQLERAAEEVRHEVQEHDGEDILQSVLEAAETVVDPGLQEIILGAALRVAYGDYDIDKEEARCLKALADAWGLTLQSVAS